MRLSVDLLADCERAWTARGITKREFFERALRRELQAAAGTQETLDIDVRKECA